MIQYYKGDVLSALDTSETETKVLIHICNNKGGWGKGFVTSLSKKWKEPEKFYRNCFNLNHQNKLGDIQQCCPVKNVYVVNMIVQNGYKSIFNKCPLDYDALTVCLKKTSDWLIYMGMRSPSIYCPKIGTGLAGGDWDIIKPILEEELANFPINVYEL